MLSKQLDAKRLALLKEAAPKLKRVAVFTLYRLDRPFNAATQAGTDALEISIFKVSVVKDDLEAAFERARQSGADGVLVIDYPLAYSNPHLRALGKLAERHRLPMMHSAFTARDAGGLLTYAIDKIDVVHKVGAYVHKILRGAKAGDLPIEKLSKFELTVNLKAARAIGLPILASILTQASRVID